MSQALTVGAGMARGGRVAGDPLRELARARLRVSLLLTAAVVSIYFGFIGAVAFARPALGWLLAPGLSLGILLGAAVIVVSWMLTWIYVRWANTYYDAAVRDLRR